MANRDFRDFQWTTKTDSRVLPSTSSARKLTLALSRKKGATQKCTLWLSSRRIRLVLSRFNCGGVISEKAVFAGAAEADGVRACALTALASAFVLRASMGAAAAEKVRAGWKDLFGASIRAEAAIWRSQPAFVELKRPLKGHSTSQTSRPKMFGRRSDQPHHVLIVQQYHPPDPSEVFAFSKQTLMSTRCLSRAKNMSETCASDAISLATRPCPNFVPTEREK